MKMRVIANIDPVDRIILRHHLNKGGNVQKMFVNEVAKQCDPYVPFMKGYLKNTRTITPEYIHYTQPYAGKQYRENKGNGLRGKLGIDACGLIKAK